MDLRRAAARKLMATTLRSLVEGADCKQFFGTDVCHLSRLAATAAGAAWGQVGSSMPELLGKLVDQLLGSRRQAVAVDFLEAAQKVCCHVATRLDD